MLCARGETLIVKCHPQIPIPSDEVRKVLVSGPQESHWLCLPLSQVWLPIYSMGSMAYLLLGSRRQRPSSGKGEQPSCRPQEQMRQFFTSQRPDNLFLTWNLDDKSVWSAPEPRPSPNAFLFKLRPRLRAWNQTEQFI